MLGFKKVRLAIAMVARTTKGRRASLLFTIVPSLESILVIITAVATL